MSLLSKKKPSKSATIVAGSAGKDLPAKGQKNTTGRGRGHDKMPGPDVFQPMLATLVDAPIDEPGWTYEIKWDGYRAVAFLDKGKADLISRNNKSFNQKFYPVYDALKQWNINAIVDGEIIV